MEKKKIVRQKYFVAKELRLSIALIILWTLLVTAFFTYIAKELSGKLGHGVPLFIITMFGYGIIIVILTLLFSHRLIGPFQRLKAEMKLILAGEYGRRLRIRKNDDIYIRSFVDQVNEVLERLQGLHDINQRLIREIESELLNILSKIEEQDTTTDQIRKMILSLHKRIKGLKESADFN